MFIYKWVYLCLHLFHVFLFALYKQYCLANYLLSLKFSYNYCDSTAAADLIVVLHVLN